MSALVHPDPPLTDGVVALRAWREQDAAAKVAALAGDPLILRFTEVGEDYDEARALAFIHELEAERQAGRMLGFAIVDAPSGDVLGSVELRLDAVDPLVGELGYLLGPRARGRGQMTRALRLLLGYAFERLDLARVQAFVHPDNERSIVLLERLGFEREGLLRSYRATRYGRQDRVLLAILSPPARGGDGPPG